MAEACARCGRPVDGSASIDGVAYCHPPWGTGRSCYTEQSYDNATSSLRLTLVERIAIAIMAPLVSLALWTVIR